MPGRRPQLRLTIRGPLAREDLPGLSARVCHLLRTAASPDVRCDVEGVAADAVSVDALARLQLAAHRHGCTIRLVNASGDLLALVDLMGLTHVLTA